MDTPEPSKLDQLFTFLRVKLEGKLSSKTVQRKLDNPEKLAEQLSHDIGSDSQRISLK